MVSAVVMGDIGWPHLYHVGDEAMTEAAVVQLRERGVDGITLVAADERTTADLHGLDAVPRFHFKLRWPRDWHDSHLQKVLAPLVGYERGPGDAVSVLDAVHDADFVLVAGGGNLTSDYVHQMYERLALVRVARHFDKPVVFTSQTLDPRYLDRDVPVIREILDGAARFGLREATSVAVAETLIHDPSTLRATGDDGLLTRRLPPTAEVQGLLPERYLTATFERPTWLPDEALEGYWGRVAAALDAVAAATDCEVVLVPHAGSFDESHPKDDIVSHREIAARAARVVPLPMMRAGAVLEVMARSAGTISTRYHPLVFAAQVGVPAIGLARTGYTWHRMRGAARQYGAERFVLPIDATSDPDAFAEAVRECFGRSSLRERLQRVAQTRIDAQSKWWDEVLSVIDPATPEPPSGPDLGEELRTVPEPVAGPRSTEAFPDLLADESTARGEAESLAQRSIALLDAAVGERDEARRGLEHDRALLEEWRAEVLELTARLDHALEDGRERERQRLGAEALVSGLREDVRRAADDRDEWRRAARSFRAEVQRYRDRRTTRAVDLLGKLLRRS